MFFDLTNEEKQLRDGVDRLLGHTLDLNAIAADNSLIAPKREAIDSAFAEMGLPLVMLDESNGGMGLGLLALTAVAHVMGKNCAPSNAIDQALATWLVGEYGSQSQRARWLAGLISGNLSSHIALGDKSAYWQPQQCAASLDNKSIAKLNVEMAKGPGLIVVGTREGLCVAEVDQHDFVAYPSSLDPTRPLGSLELPTDRAEFIAGPDAAQRLFEALLVLRASDSAGAGQRALAMTVDYAKTRQQFGQPIGAFQALKHQLANMAVDIEPAHFPCWFAAYAWQSGAPDSLRSALLAKAHATDVAVKTCRAAVEAHGGIAYTWEYPLHLLLKRAMQNRSLVGTPMALREAIAKLDASKLG